MQGPHLLFATRIILHVFNEGLHLLSVEGLWGDGDGVRSSALLDMIIVYDGAANVDRG